MSEKRKFKRVQCYLKIVYDYYNGNPDEIDIKVAAPVKGKGYMLDISMGGAFVVTNSRHGINTPVKLHLSSGKKKHEIDGAIIRTGLLKNNPSEVAQKYAAAKVKEDVYIAIKFEEAYIQFTEADFESK
jgi:hypothetical protein